jgi:ribosomal protein L18E
MDRIEELVDLLDKLTREERMLYVRRIAKRLRKQQRQLNAYRYRIAELKTAQLLATQPV